MAGPIRQFFDFFGFAQSTFGKFLLATVLLIAMLIAVWTLVQKFAELLGKPIGAARQRKEDHESIVKMQKQMQQLEQQQDQDRSNSIKHDRKIQQRQEDIYNMLMEMRIKDMRYQILDCASRISSGSKISKEYLSHILDTYTEYEEALTKMGRSNGKTQASMDVIRKKYEEYLENGFPDN